jgi:hypothetical protein
MWMPLATLAAVTLTTAQQPDTLHVGQGQGRGQGRGEGSGDTTLAVQSGARLDVNNFGGEIVVHTWNQNNVRVKASHSSRSRVDVSVSGSTVLVRTAGRRGPPSIVDLDISIPAWMGMTLNGTYTDISVQGAGGAVTAESVQGDIEVTGGTGNISLKSVEGGVTLSKTKGRIDVNSVEGDITITDATGGDITVESVNGDIALMRIDAANVDVNTVDGDVTYDGTIKSSGSYRLATHDGDVTVVIPPAACASGSVSTFDGDFDASFAVDTVRAGKHRFTFSAGRCSSPAKIEVETFDGDIQLRRPGEVELETPKHGKYKNEHDNDHDYNFNFNFDFDNAKYATYTNPAEYSQAYAKDYAPRYARQYARTYSRLFARTTVKQWKLERRTRCDSC